MPDQDQPIEFGEEPIEPGTTALEQKYNKEMRQIVSQKIDLPISTLPEMIKEQIDLNPDFQRRDRWDVDKQSRFIESIIMNVPIPPVFLGEDQYGKYVVLDGRQRLTAIRDFLSNLYKLSGLKVWEDLNGQNYNDLQKKKLAAAITRRFIPAVVILKESSSQVKYDVFDRLNTGGVIAEPMEIRNAVFQGVFNKLIRDLADLAEFRRLWEIPSGPGQIEKNRLYRDMSDVELVLRFFALSEYEQMDMKFKDYLGDFMDRRNKEYIKNPDLAATDRERFRRAIENCWIVFGADVFRKSAGAKKSAPLADAVMISLADYPSDVVIARAANIRAAINTLLTGDEERHKEFQKAFGTGTNGKGAIRTRVELAKEAVKVAIEQ
ncbi:MAG: DUF262 domain-containing protein [Candidatus Acidiferrum sp.]